MKRKARKIQFNAACRLQGRVASPQFSVLTNDAPGQGYLLLKVDFLMAESLCRIIMQQPAGPHRPSWDFLPRSSSSVSTLKPSSSHLDSSSRRSPGQEVQTNKGRRRVPVPSGEKAPNGLEPMRCLIDDTAASDFGSGPRQREPQGVKDPNRNEARPPRAGTGHRALH